MAYRNFGSRSKYARKAYTYVNSRGKSVSVPARPGLHSPPRKTRRTTTPTSGLGPRAAVPAPQTATKPRKGYKVDSPLRARIPAAGRVVGRIGTKQGQRRLTQKHATKNIAKRRGRKLVRKVLPGSALIKVKRRK